MHNGMLWSTVETPIRWDESQFGNPPIASDALLTLHIVKREAQLYPQTSHPTPHYLILPHSPVRFQPLVLLHQLSHPPYPSPDPTVLTSPVPPQRQVRTHRQLVAARRDRFCENII